MTVKQAASSLPCFAMSHISQESSCAEQEVNTNLKHKTLLTAKFVFLTSLMMFNEQEIVTMETSLTKVWCLLSSRVRQGFCLYQQSLSEERMAFQRHLRSNSYMKIHSPVIRCVPDVTHIGHPLIPAPSFLSSQCKFKIQLAEVSPGNAGIECSMKPNLWNQLFPIALL